MKKLLTFISTIILGLTLTSCSNGSKQTIVFGTMAQPGEPLIEYIKDDFEAKGYTLKIETFSEFSMGNPGLVNGSYDATLFQHKPYLDTYNNDTNNNLLSATTVYTCTYGGYSYKINNVEELKTVYESSGISPRVTIANDSSNGLRCLNILKSEGLIDFDEAVYVSNPSEPNSSLTNNPYNLNIEAISASLITSSLDDSDCYLGIVNATYAIAAGLSEDNLICQESEETNITNANILAIRENDKDEQWVKDLIECITSDKAATFINETFKGVVKPYFDGINDLE